MDPIAAERLIRGIFIGNCRGVADRFVAVRQDGEQHATIEYKPSALAQVQRLEYVAVYSRVDTHDTLYVPQWMVRMSATREGDMIRDLAPYMDHGVF